MSEIYILEYAYEKEGPFELECCIRDSNAVKDYLQKHNIELPNATNIYNDGGIMFNGVYWKQDNSKKPKYVDVYWHLYKKELFG